MTEHGLERRAEVGYPELDVRVGGREDAKDLVGKSLAETPHIVEAQFDDLELVEARRHPPGFGPRYVFVAEEPL